MPSFQLTCHQFCCEAKVGFVVRDLSQQMQAVHRIRAKMSSAFWRHQDLCLLLKTVLYMTKSYFELVKKWRTKICMRGMYCSDQMGHPMPEVIDHEQDVQDEIEGTLLTDGEVLGGCRELFLFGSLFFICIYSSVQNSRSWGLISDIFLKCQMLKN